MIEQIQLFLAATAALLPLLGLTALLWRRYYREDSENTARRVVKNSAVPTVTRFVVKAVDAGFALVLFRLLPADSVGQFSLATLLVVQYLGTFADFGLGTLLTREVARRPEEAPRYFSSTLLLRWGFTLTTIPLALTVVGAYSGLSLLFPDSKALTPEGSGAILILCLMLFPASYSSVVTALLNARERMEIPAAIEIVTEVVSVFARVGVLLAGWGVLGLAWAAVGSAVFTSLVFLVIQLRLLFTPRLVWDVRFVRRLLRPAMPLMLNNLLVTAAFSLDSFILRFYADDLAVAQYRMPYQVLSVALLLSPLLTNAVFPVIARYAEDDRSAFNRTYQRTLQVLLIAAFPITVATTILATDLVYFVVGGRAASSFVGASDVALAILIWFLPLSYLNGLTQYALIALNRQGWITRSFMVMAVFNAAGNLLLIPHFGMYAASVLTVLSEIVLFAMFLPVLRRESAGPPLWRLAWRPVLAASFMGMVMVAIHAFGAMLSLAGGILVYAGLLYLLGAFGAEERALVRRVIGW